MFIYIYLNIIQWNKVIKILDWDLTKDIIKLMLLELCWED